MEFTVAKASPSRSGPLPRAIPPEAASKSTPLPLPIPNDPFLLEPESKKKSELARRQDEFRRLMNLSDELLEDYSCAMRPSKQGVFVQGRLYISDKHVCFGTIFLPEGVIPYDEIVRIRKRTTAYVFANAIDVVTKTEKLYFASFIYRDEAFDMIKRQWNKLNDGELPTSDGSDGETTTTDEDVDPTEGLPQPTLSGSDSDGPEDVSAFSNHPLRTKMSLSSPAVPQKSDSTPTSIVKSDDKLPTKRKLFQKNQVKKPKDKDKVTTSDDSDPESAARSASGEVVKKSASLKDKGKDKDKDKEKSKSGSKDKKKKDSLDDSSSPMGMEIEGRSRSKTISSKKKKKFSIDNSSKDKTRAKRSRSVGDSDEVLKRTIHEEGENATSSIVGSGQSDSDGSAHDLLSSSDFELPSPPISDSHPLFRDEYKRNTIVQRELKCDVTEFYKLFWASRKFYDKFAEKLQYYDTSVAPWKPTAPPGCFERRVGWSVALNGFAIGPKSATVDQTQRARFKNKFHLEIETSGRSIGVPFAENFTAEERWMVMTTSAGIKVVVEACVNWSSVPWSASMLRSTIDSAAMKSSITNANLFLDLASDVIEDRRTGADERRRKRLTTKAVRHASVSLHEEEGSPQTSSAPTPVKTAPPPSAPAPSLDGLVASPYVRGGLSIAALTVVLLVGYLFLLGSRVSALESQLAKVHLDEHIVSKVAFLEFFVSQLHKNLTGTSKFDELFEFWSKSSHIKEQLNAMQDSIHKLMLSLDEQKKSSLRGQVELNEDALRSIDARMRLMQPAQTWLSFFLYWVFIVSLVLGVSYLIKLFADGKLKVKTQ